MRTKLFLVAIVIILGTPIFLLGRWAYENHQVVARAQELFNQIPKYPEAKFVEKYHSLYSLGYGETYSINSNHTNTINFYKGSIKTPWVFKEENGSSGDTNVHNIIYRFQDFQLNISVDSGNNDLNKSNAPFYLNVDISQVP